ncbi:TetR/AcrR family transcriptional regulator [Novosphingobium sp. PS1R-30]|uniref:TetR/AcrR family transcriptional regulator n=1 Tax=Novosphingobium anseongense TaxID=3133436 RepID=A0ABU8S2T8_9SPHN
MESPAKTAAAKSTRRIGAQNSAGRDAILKAAIGVLQEEGAAGLTASNVAKKADVKAHMVHYYFRSIEDLVLALIRQHGSLGLKNTARAIASDEPLRALWEVETSFKWMSVAMELSNIAIRREDMRAEMMRYIEDMRNLQAEGIQRHFQLRGIECAVPPKALTIMVAGIARQIVREKEFDVSLGHDEMAAVVETFLDSLKPAPQ